MKYYPAPAKLNLFLHVVGRRADGYHLLQSVFRLIDFGDEVGIAVRSDGAIKRLGDVAGVTEANDLTLRAARLLKERTGCPLGAEVMLVKRLPLGGGVGGGSSDAATALLVLNHLWQTGLTRGQLMQLGAELGADVPFFVFGESAFAEGVGDKLAAISVSPAWYLVLVPGVAISSREIFSAAELKRDTPGIAIGDYAEGWGDNALQTVACGRYPEVARHLDWLSRHGDARMTGSGACVFAPFSSEAAARGVLAELPAGMRGFVAEGLDRHPLHGFAAGD